MPDSLKFQFGEEPHEIVGTGVPITSQMMNAPDLHNFCLAGHLSNSWAARFEGLSMRHEPEGETMLSGTLDQIALEGIFVMLCYSKPNVCEYYPVPEIILQKLFESGLILFSRPNPFRAFDFLFYYFFAATSRRSKQCLRDSIGEIFASDYDLSVSRFFRLQ